MNTANIPILDLPRDLDEMTLDKAREIPLCDMNQAELTCVILHDPDLSERRAALRLFKTDILSDAEIRIMQALARART